MQRVIGEGNVGIDSDSRPARGEFETRGPYIGLNIITYRFNDVIVDSESELSLNQRVEIDRLAEQFEREFKAGKNPRMEDYLQKQPSPSLRASLLKKLVALEIELRLAAGDEVSGAGYQERFPEAKEIIAALLSERLDETIDQKITTASESDESPPEQLGRYKIQKVLGRGGFGVVYLARDTQLDRSVALKVPRRERFQTAEEFETFIEEARKAANLNHPSLVAVYDVQEENGLPYIVQEYIDGENLASIIETEAPIPQEAAAKVVLDVAAGLAHVHSKGIQHLDVKPQNILVARSGRAMLSDFGLAINDDEKWTCGGRGTLIYMAPEQLKADSPQFDGRTDIWSLGVVLYEMLTKHRPFDGGTGPSRRDNLAHCDSTCSS